MSRVFGVVWPRRGEAKQSKATAQFAVLPFVALALVMSAVDPWADFEVGLSSPLLVFRLPLTVIP
jgi:hypothetical protein